ncbi:hypothetical protein [Azospirillum sp.]|uniref:hypothetical protein n=1 Tax=Azospirillum sp. TaxID=34012 RepID=UPI003D75CD85
MAGCLAVAVLAALPGTAGARVPHSPAGDPLQTLWQRPKTAPNPNAPPSCVDEEPPGQAVLDAAAGGDEAVARLARERPADVLRCSDLFPGAAANEALLAAARAAPYDAVGAVERLSVRPGGAAIVEAAFDAALLERALDNGLPFYQTRHELRRRLQPAAVRALEGRAAKLLAAAFRQDPVAVSSQIGILLDDMSEDHPADRFRVALALPADSLFELIAHAGPQLYTSSLDGLVNVLRLQLKQEKRNFLDLARAPGTRALWAKFFVAVVSSGRARDLFDATAGDVRELARVSVAALLAPGHGVAPPIVAGALADAMTIRLVPARMALEDEVAAFHRTTQDPQAKAVAGLAGGLHALRLSGRPASPAFQAERFGELYRLPPPPALSEERLFQRGVNWQRMTFYDDRDGRASFRAFVQQRRALGWAINNHGGFITAASPERRGRRIVIIADVPGSGEAGRAALRAWLEQHGVSPTIVVHRGHSYHEDGTMTEIAAATALVFWGSCGGHVRLGATLEQAPDAQVLATQNMGISTVNQALLRIIEERLLTSGTIDWSAVWADAQAQIHDRRFGAYKRPDQDSTNLALRGWRVQADRVAKLPGN